MHELYLRELVDYIKDNKPGKDELSKFKIKLCAKHKVRAMPSDIEVLTSLNHDDALLLVQYLQTKPVRSQSGVAVVAVMTKPRKCPHGKCSYCPGGPKSYFGNVPQSYTGMEPATRRAMRNNFDPYLQVFNRLEQYVASGHFPQKIELIVMGGTFPAYPLKYQKQFVTYLFKALNDFSRFFVNGKLDLPRFKVFFELPGKLDDEKRAQSIRKKVLALKSNSDLLKEQRRNETAFVRCVGLTIETRPDYATQSHADLMLELGCTRIEMGVQSLSDEVLRKVDRGHTVCDTIAATKVLKDLGFKINYHMMLGLPGSNPKEDIQMFRKLFSDSAFQPDMLKIYPCMVLKGTRLFDQYNAGEFVPMTTEVAAATIAEIKQYVPEYVRIMRVQRDIPTDVCVAGVDRTNLRQYIHDKKVDCSCIRCRQA
ncbi:MAG: tRNA uridine(34) 5-carboxymethylaminomethyl modification radical SAM/GNAT enzyme Elp3, partial [Candidatus Woesearchaeota archaeon]